MSQKQETKIDKIFRWLAKGTRAEPWPTAEEIREIRAIREKERAKLFQDIVKKQSEQNNQKK